VISSLGTGMGKIMRYVIFSEGPGPLLNINAIGYAGSETVTRFGPGQRNEYIIHYVLSGKGYFNGNPVTGGYGFLITPGMMEEYYPDSEEPWEFLWATSNSPQMADLYPYFHADGKTHIFQYQDPQILRRMADRVVLNRNTAYSSFEMLEFFMGIFKQHGNCRGAQQTKGAADLYAEAAVNYINNNLYNAITVKELTEITGISQPYLFKIFTEKFGKSPKQYISDRKLLYAQKLLRETDLTVTQIAASVGFGDVLAFSKFFAGHVGVSPRKYREQIFDTT